MRRILWLALFLPLLAQVVTFEDLAKRLKTPDEAMDYYLQLANNTSLYTPVSLDPRTYLIKLLIAPCPVSNVFCCQGKGEGACKETLVVPGGSSLIVVWASNNFVVTCANEFAESLECGT